MRKQKSRPDAKPEQFLLVPTPTPLEGPLRTDEDIAQHRRLHCAHYDGCLNQSVRQGWLGFTCMHCPLRDLARAGPGSAPFAYQSRSLDPNQ